MASPNSSSKPEAEPSKPKEINNHFPGKKRGDRLKEAEREEVKRASNRRGGKCKWLRQQLPRQSFSLENA